MNQPLLKVDKIHTYYGNSHILQGVSLEVAQGEVVILAGRHGVGKTTTLLSLMVIQPPSQGTISFNQTIISGKPSWQIARLGLGLVPEKRLLFPQLTVQENLEVAQRKAQDNYTLEQAFQDFPELIQFRHKLACNLSGGQQQMLTIARTLMGNPTLILMDEPTEGLAPILVERITEIINNLKIRGKTILITGQNLEFAYLLAQQIYILDTGIIQWSGKIEQLHEETEIWQRYLVL